MGTGATERVLEYGRLAMGFANVRAGTRVLIAGAGAGPTRLQANATGAAVVFEDFGPLFRLLRGRRWSAVPHAARAPAGVRRAAKPHLGLYIWRALF